MLILGIIAIASTPSPAIIALILMGLAGAAVASDCRHNILRILSARNVFLLTICLWYLAEAILQPAALQDYTKAAQYTAIGCVALWLAGFLIGYSHLGHRFAAWQLPDLSGLDNPQILWNTFLLASAIGITPLLLVSQGNVWTILEDAFYLKPRWSSLFQRGRYGDSRDALLELQMFLRAATPLAAAIFVGRHSKWVQRFVSGSLLAYMIARGLHDGSRLRLVEVMLPILAAILWCCPVHLKRTAFLFLLPVCAAIGILWAAAVVQGRDSGRFRWRDAANVNYTGFEMFRELLFLQEHVPRYSPWRFGYTYYVQLINPIPRFLWPDKPVEDAGLQLALLQNEVVHGEPKLTIAPGLIGEIYWNFGFAGIPLVAAVIGVATRWWDRLNRLSLPQFTAFASGLAVIFATGRSINMSNIYGLLALFATLIAVRRLPQQWVGSTE